MKRLCVLLVVLCLLCLPGLSLAADKAAGYTEMAKGKVEAEAAGAVRGLQVASAVFVEDTLLTGAASAAQFLFSDGSKLTMAENSRLAVAAYNYEPAVSKQALRAVFNAAKGLYRFITGRIADKNKQGYTVETPLMEVGIRGTEVGLQVKEGLSLVSVFSGGPVLVIDKESGESTEISAGMSAVKEAGKPLSTGTTTPEQKSIFDAVPVVPKSDLPPPPPGSGC